MSDDFVLSERHRELLAELRDCEAYGKDADKRAAELEAKVAELGAERERLRAVLEKCVEALHQEALASDHFLHSPQHAAWFNLRMIAMQALQPAQKEQ